MRAKPGLRSWHPTTCAGRARVCATRRRGVGTDPIPRGPRLDADYRAIPLLQAAHPVRGERPDWYRVRKLTLGEHDVRLADDPAGCLHVIASRVSWLLRRRAPVSTSSFAAARRIWSVASFPAARNGQENRGGLLHERRLLLKRKRQVSVALCLRGQRGKSPAPTRNAGNPAWATSSTPARLSAILRKSAAVVDRFPYLRGYLIALDGTLASPRQLRP
jgi:hypothetical protein